MIARAAGRRQIAQPVRVVRRRYGGGGGGNAVLAIGAAVRYTPVVTVRKEVRCGFW